MITIKQARAAALGLTVFLASLTGCQTPLPTNQPPNPAASSLNATGQPYGLQDTGEVQQAVASDWLVGSDFDCFSSEMGPGSAGCQHDKIPSYMNVSIPGAMWITKSRRDVWGSEILSLSTGFSIPEGATLKRVKVDYSYHGWGIRGYDLSRSSSSDSFDPENDPQQATRVLFGEKEESTPPSRQTLTLEGDQLKKPDGSPIEGLRFFVAGFMTDPAFIGKVTIDYIKAPEPSPTPGLKCPIPPLQTLKESEVNIESANYNTFHFATDEQIGLSYHSAWESGFTINRYTGFSMEEEAIVKCALLHTASKFFWDPEHPYLSAVLIVTPYLGPAKSLRAIMVSGNTLKSSYLTIKIGTSGQKGKVAEWIAENIGYKKNNAKFTEEFSNGISTRIPDSIGKSFNPSIKSHIVEVKNKHYQWNSTQIKHDVELKNMWNSKLEPGQSPYEVILALPKSAKVSKPLQDAINANDIKRIDLELVINCKNIKW